MGTAAGQPFPVGISPAGFQGAVPSPVPKATRGHWDTERGLVAPSQLPPRDCPLGPTGLAARERQRKNSSPQHCSCHLKSRKSPKELLLGERGSQGHSGLVAPDKGPAPQP